MVTMDVRAQVAAVFHLDKCIGCHTCSVACKNLWTDRAGAEYQWWNNVETKPGTGYPTKWEDQETWRGGWETNGDLRLRAQGRAGALAKLFYNPRQPGLDDYYEPWTYRYDDLFEAEAGADQPSARPVSQITGKPMEIEAGPNWDDDLSGSPVYAENDPNLDALSAQDRAALFAVERLAMMYLPRTCNHCANPACVASCPSGAVYKRGEDGIVLASQEACRGWRACVVGCPYKKIYFNWKSGKSEKCILCYPRLEAGQPSACFHACVGRIRYQGVLLYDASRIREVASAPAEGIVEAQRSMLLDPFDPGVVGAAERAGVPAQTIRAAQLSPVFKFVRAWGLALPLHPEFRTLPMIFYVPPLLPVMGRMDRGVYARDREGTQAAASLFAGVDEARIPVRYLAALFTAGNEELVRASLRKLVAVRAYRRTLDDPGGVTGLEGVLADAGLTREAAEAIYRLTALATLEDRYVLPPLQREAGMAAEAAEQLREACGLGDIAPRRR